MLAYPSLVYLHCVLAECQCVCASVNVEVSVYVVRMWWKCQCVSVSVEVSVFKGCSGRTLRNAFGKNNPKTRYAMEKIVFSKGSDCACRAYRRDMERPNRFHSKHAAGSSHCLQAQEAFSPPPRTVEMPEEGGTGPLHRDTSRQLTSAGGFELDSFFITCGDKLETFPDPSSFSGDSRHC